MSGSKVDEKSLKALLGELVRIDSVNPSLVPGAAGEAEVARYIGEWMEKLGLETRVYDVEPGRTNAVGVLKGEGGGRSLILNGHSDTVGVNYYEGDPFKPLVKGGRMYGRGAFDMKGGLAACMAAVKAVVDSGARLKGNVILAAVCDEEYASIGTERLVEEYSTDAAIVGEPTGGNVLVAHKGFAWVDVVTHGVAAHGSAFNEGVDAIAKMGGVLTGLEGLQRSLQGAMHPLVGPGSVHASIIEGGSELSTYPASCRLQLERRLIPGENQETVEREMEAMLRSLGKADQKFRAEHKVAFYRAPMEVSPEEPICRALVEASANVLGREPLFIGGSGWLDTQIMTGRGIPSVSYGPSGDGAHAKTEWVDLRSVADAARVQEHAVKAFCGLA
jgi:acetylornithine deacetylase